MLKIPTIYKDSAHDYITMPAILRFMKHHCIRYNPTASREEHFESIVNYGNASSQNAKYVLSWIDDVVLEGIRDVYVRYFPLVQKIKAILSAPASIDSYFAAFIQEGIKPHVCSNQYGKDFTLVSVRLAGEGVGRKIVFTYCKKLHVFQEKKGVHRRTQIIDYPVVAEYYFEGQWLSVTAKPRSNLYVYINDNFDLENAEITSTEKQIIEVFEKVATILTKDNVSETTEEEKLKNKLFYLIDKYTKTPKEIKNILESETERLEIIKRAFVEMCKVEDKCHISSLGALESDIKNMAEKYLSINWRDETIFMQDREAYPIRLKATDDEYSKMDQSSRLQKPLQTKSIFFDNKKMLYDTKTCDGAMFMWSAKPKSYFPNEFPVAISVTTMGLFLKFTKYTMKEDIENVVFSVVGANENTNKSG